ncbi:MAG: hypothetical protein LBG92_04340 [Prevotellaceae bacterium]|jgi:hypothetical protein|nr:hypothetical protein [Prevotellaceae bacterium]
MKKLTVAFLFVLYCSGIHAQNTVSLLVMGDAGDMVRSTSSDIITEILTANGYVVGDENAIFFLSVDIHSEGENFAFKLKFRNEINFSTAQGYADLEDVIRENMKTVLAYFSEVRAKMNVGNVGKAGNVGNVGNVGKTEKPKPALPLQDIYCVGSRIYDASGRKLSTAEVRKIFNGTAAFQQYNRGFRQKKTGNILLWSGIVAAAAGGILLASVDPEQIQYESYTTYYEEDPLFLAGELAVLAGAGAIAGGIVFKICGKKSVKKSCDTYKSSRNYSFNPEWQFGLTPTGIGFTVNF